MKKQPEEMTLAKLEVLIMPNGEILCSGKQVGYFKDLKERLSEPRKAV